MESSEVGLYKSRKRKEPNELQSEKQNTSNCNESKRRKEPHVYLNEHIGHVTETSSKTKKVVPESSLGRDQQLPSPPKGNSVVILALNAVSEGNKTVQSKNKTSNSSKNNNVVHDMVEKERAASKITEVHEEVCASQKKLKKKPSERRKKIVVESGSEKLSETLITNRSAQNLSEQKSERVDGKISIKLLVAAEANQKIDHDTLCNIQRKDVQHNKSSEPASETVELHEEVCVQKKLKKKVVSKNKIINSSKNNNVVQDIVEKERAASETADKEEEVCVQKKLKKSHCKRRKKSAAESGSEKLSETLVTKHSDQQKVDDSPFCKFENKNDQVGEGVGSESQGDDKKDVCLMRKKGKRKEKRQTDKINKNTWERGCQDVSDTSDTKGLGLDNSVPATSGLALVRKEKINEVLSDCVNINSTNNDYLCNENETSLVDLQSSKTHRRKDKTFSLGKMESRIDKTRFKASFDSLNASENKGGDNLKDEDELNICQKVIPADSYTEEEKWSWSSNFFPNVNMECSKDPKLEFGRNRKETQMEVSESTHQDKTLNDHLPQENGGISRKVQKTKPNDVSYSNTLEVMSERGKPSGLCRKDYDSLSQNDKVLSVDESSTNQSNKRSVSKKKRRKNKTKHTSDQANASDNLSTSDPSAKQHCSISEGAIEASCNNCRMEETSPSAGDIRKEVIIVATESTKDELHNRSASSGTGQIMQSSRKLLILDLNGLLVDIVSVLPKGCIADKRIGKRLLIKRPFCDDFVKFCFETFNVGVWSSRTKINVDKVVDFIMGDYRHKLLFCWHQSQCTPTGFNTIEAAHKPMVFKEIKKLWDQRVLGLPWNKGDYNESNTLLLDDSPYKALLNPPYTAIFPDSYKCWNANDNALGPGGKIREYLEGIATAEDVQKYVEYNPFGQRAVTSRSSSWGYYLRIIRANRLCLPT